MADLVFNVEAHIGLITLNRAASLNALTLPMILSLKQQLLSWNEAEDIHAIVIQSASDKAFCAGGDVRWLYDAGKKQDPHQLDFFKEEYELNGLIHQLKKPYVALMNGLTMGGGVGISLHGSHPVASEQFVFAMPETSIGFFPDIGASALLSRCPYEYGTYLGLTGSRLNAEEAYHLGLVKYVIPCDQFDELLAQLVRTDLSKDAHAQVNQLLQSMTRLSSDFSLAHQQWIEAIFKHTSMEAIFNALGEGNEMWHRDTLSLLKQKSPLSLKVVRLQLIKAKTMSLSQCLQMDMTLVRHFMQSHDFYEGVRALLVDKDKSPHWCHERLSDVHDDEVKAYFL